MVVLINSNNQILCGDQFIDIKQLKEKIKDFIDNPFNDEHKPEKVEVDVPFFGKQMVTKNHVISLQNDRVLNTKLISTFKMRSQPHTTN